MFEIGRVCMKLAGRDAGRMCVVVDVLDKQHVLVDGETRRRKCNMRHLEPTSKLVEISKNAPHAEVERAMKELGFGYSKKEKKTEKKSHAPKRKRVQKAKPVATPTKQSADKKEKATKKE